MLPNMNLSEARRETVNPGGYIVKIISVNIDNKYNRLQLHVDIAEGEHKGYYTKLNERFPDFWGFDINLPMEKERAWKFARGIDAIRDSNEGFTWNDDGENDERTLIGMYCGVVAQRYHYLGGDGTEKTKLIAHKTVPVSDIRNGNFEVPKDSYHEDLKRFQPPTGVVDTTANFGPVNDDDIPF